MAKIKEKPILNKKERIKHKVIWVLAVLMVLEVCGFSAYVFFSNYADNKVVQSGLSVYTQQIQELKSIKERDGVGALSEINPAFVGWLSCVDAGIEIPVVQATTADEEKFYLSHDFYQRSNACGVPYVRAGADISSTDNSTIVGHSAFLYLGGGTTQILSNLYTYIENANKVRNGGEDTLSYLVTIETATKTYTYQVFSTFSFAVKNDYATEYSIYDAKTFATETEFNTFYNNVKTLSVMDSTLTANYGDKFLTFITCSKQSTAERVMVVAKLIA